MTYSNLWETCLLHLIITEVSLKENSMSKYFPLKHKEICNSWIHHYILLHTLGQWYHSGCFILHLSFTAMLLGASSYFPLPLTMAAILEQKDFISYMSAHCSKEELVNPLTMENRVVMTLPETVSSTFPSSWIEQKAFYVVLPLWFWSGVWVHLKC